MRVLVSGSRNWGSRPGDLAKMYQRLNKLPKKDLVIIEGEANGADKMSVEWVFDAFPNSAEKHLARFPADWATKHRAAGSIRNQQMLDEGKPELVIAFHEDINASRGTKDMMNRARKAGVTVELIS